MFSINTKANYVQPSRTMYFRNGISAAGAFLDFQAFNTFHLSQEICKIFKTNSIKLGLLDATSWNARHSIHFHQQ